jgi:hypothetical protein
MKGSSARLVRKAVTFFWSDARKLRVRLYAGYAAEAGLGKGSESPCRRKTLAPESVASYNEVIPIPLVL